MTAALGIDVGGGGSRWLLVDASGAELAAGTAPPLTGHLYHADARAEADAALNALATALAGAPVAAIVAGVTGVVDDAPEVALLTDEFSRRLGTPADAIAVHDDQWLAYHAAFVPGAGILVYGGTGSFAIHVDTGGVTHRTGGHGYVLGDGGSGFWIGRTALTWLIETMDATGGSPTGPLADGLADAIGGRAWADIRTWAYAEPRRNVAALAPAVAVTADAGDPVAREILDRAGGKLAQLALRLGGRVGRLSCGLAGAAALGHPRVAAAFNATLAAHWPDAAAVRCIETPPVIAAARLAAARL